jgi:hypothetical protein
MDIKISILEKRIKGKYINPIILEFHGNFALEIMFQKISEKYFGNEVSLLIQKILTGRITKDELEGMIENEF